MTNLDDRQLGDLFRESFDAMMPGVLEGSELVGGVAFARGSSTLGPATVVQRPRRLVFVMAAALVVAVAAGVTALGMRTTPAQVPADTAPPLASVSTLPPNPVVAPTSSAGTPIAIDSDASTTQTSITGAPSHGPRPGQALTLPDEGWMTLFAQTFEIVVQGCMTNLGFDYTPRPPVGTSPEAQAAADEWEQWRQQQFATVPGYEKALYGVDPETDPGCELDAFPVMFPGSIRSDQIAANFESAHQSEWRHTALQDEQLAPDIAELTTCLARDGYSVTPTRDVLRAAGQFEKNTGTPLSTICPVWTEFTERLADLTDVVEQQWFAANPEALAKIKDRYAADIVRFEHIVATSTSG
ncbi:MAG: hypothetical protein JWM34_5078 [Ilumatobacteraceae bacterium]|nr:hypothetical protein [Ilumatobacteraceae bacterium]